MTITVNVILRKPNYGCHLSKKNQQFINRKTKNRNESYPDRYASYCCWTTTFYAMDRRNETCPTFPRENTYCTQMQRSFSFLDYLAQDDFARSVLHLCCRSLTAQHRGPTTVTQSKLSLSFLHYPS